MTKQPDHPPLEDPLAALERELIAAFLAGAGHDYKTLIGREDEQARKLLAQAALYASEKLSEIESRWVYLHKLHGE